MASTVCLRCNTAPPAFTLRKEAVCGPCLVSSVASKVRALLLSSPAAGRNLLLAYSGGPSSRTMLDLVRRGLDVGRRHRSFADASVVLVDTRGSDGGGGPQDEAALRIALLEAVRDGFHVRVIPVEAGFQEAVAAAAGGATLGPAVDPAGALAWTQGVLAVSPPVLPPASSDALPPHEHSGAARPDDPAVVAAVDAALAGVAGHRSSASFLAATAAMTAASEQCTPDEWGARVSSSVRSVVHAAAGLAGAHVVLWGDPVDALAARLLVELCGGRGASAPSDVAPVDARLGDTPFPAGSVPVPPSPWYPASVTRTPLGVLGPGIVSVRPLLEVEAVETAAYTTVLGLPTVSGKPVRSPGGRRNKPTVASLVAGLLTGLQAEFPSTLHNVVRTARKVKVGEGGK